MGNSDATFEKIKRLLRNDPFVPFTLRSGGQDIDVLHPNAIAFHPEVPFLTVYGRTDVYELPVEKVSYVERQSAG